MTTLRVKDIMSTPVHFLQEDESIELAEALMRMERIHHLPVVRHGLPIGLVSQWDVINAARLGPFERNDLTAKEIMTTDPLILKPTDLALDAGNMLRQRSQTAALVVDNGVLLGIVTATNFLDLALKYLSIHSL